MEWPVSWTLADTEAAHKLWNQHIEQKRAGRSGKRPITNILIEAFAQRFNGLITRNPKHFSIVEVIVPDRR